MISVWLMSTGECIDDEMEGRKWKNNLLKRRDENCDNKKIVFDTLYTHMLRLT